MVVARPALERDRLRVRERSHANGSVLIQEERNAINRRRQEGEDPRRPAGDDVEHCRRDHHHDQAGDEPGGPVEERERVTDSLDQLHCCTLSFVVGQHYHVPGARLDGRKKSAARARSIRFTYVSDDDCDDPPARTRSEKIKTPLVFRI